MDGMPSGVPALPTAESMMSDADRQAFVTDLLDRGQRVFDDTNGEVRSAASSILDGAESDLLGTLTQHADAAKDALAAADKKIAKPLREHNKAVGEHIQAAYD